MQLISLILVQRDCAIGEQTNRIQWVGIFFNPVIEATEFHYKHNIMVHESARVYL